MPGFGNPIKSIYKVSVCNLCTYVLDNLGGSLDQAWLYHELALLYDALYTYAGFLTSSDSYAIGELLAAIKAVMAGLWESKPQAALVASLKDTLVKIQIETGCIPV